MRRVLALVQERLKTLADLPHLTEYFFTEPTIDWSLVDADKQLKKLSRDEQKAILQLAVQHLTDSQFDEVSVQDTLNQILAESGHKPNVTFSIIRFALTWAPFSPNLNQMMAILGRDTVINRLNKAINS